MSLDERRVAADDTHADALEPGMPRSWHDHRGAVRPTAAVGCAKGRPGADRHRAGRRAARARAPGAGVEGGGGGVGAPGAWGARGRWRAPPPRRPPAPTPKNSAASVT
ncbi:hypothetical protein MXD58_018100, partial [Frankia sp. AgKG'84/4]|nr:hypothetical protein [Frankia sp. AgKG'84/4]